MLQHILNSNSSMPAFLQSEDCKAALLPVIAHLESAENWEVKLFQDHSINQFLSLFHAGVNALQVGKQIVWGGGWNSQEGHGIMHVLERDNDNFYTFTTCNTGGGLNYHNASARRFPKVLHNHFLAVGNIPRSRIVDDFSWAHMLWGLRFKSLDSNCAEVERLMMMMLMLLLLMMMKMVMMMMIMIIMMIMMMMMQ